MENLREHVAAARALLDDTEGVVAAAECRAMLGKEKLNRAYDWLVCNLIARTWYDGEHEEVDGEADKEVKER